MAAMIHIPFAIVKACVRFKKKSIFLLSHGHEAGRIHVSRPVDVHKGSLKHTVGYKKSITHTIGDSDNFILTPHTFRIKRKRIFCLNGKNPF